jgi:hypothetical protein
MDSDSDTPKLTFKPVRFLTKDEWLSAKEKGDSPAAKSAVVQTPSQTDGVKKKAIAAPAPKAEAEEMPEPTKRTVKKNVEPAPKKEFNDVLKQWTEEE